MAETPTDHRLGRKLAAPLAGIVLLAAAWYLWQHYPTVTPEAAAPPGPAATTRQVYFGPRNALAVLPFADRSASGDQAPQARGFAAELQARFEELPAVQVTARSSSFFFQDATIPPRVAAERLQSAWLLVGEWREANGAIAVTAALYDAYRDRELWRADYDGELGGVLRLRDAIVRDALAVLPMTRAQALAPSAEPDPRAWILLQQGRYLADPPGPSDLAAAETAFRAALEQQPDYAAARLSLAELWLHPAWPREADPEAVERARAVAQSELERPAAVANTAADRARAWGLLSYVRNHYDWRWAAAADAAQRAVDLRPGDAGLLALASLARSTLGDLGEAESLLQASLDRDPLNLGSRLRLGLVQEFSGRYDDALASYRRVLSLRPDYPAAHAYRARVKALQGKAESALKESAQESDPFWRRYAETLALLAAERREEAQSPLQRMSEEDGAVAAFQLAELFAFGGAPDEAFAWLERARAQRDPGLSALLGNPLLANLHADPRWAGLLETLALPLDAGE
jgi:TolB-like protein/Tfp pilus assembly protein PilF